MSPIKGTPPKRRRKRVRAIALLGGRLKEEKRMELEGACRTIVVVEKVKARRRSIRAGRGQRAETAAMKRACVTGTAR